MIVEWDLGRSRAIEQGQKAFAIAHNPFWKKQKQERFLRQSQGKDSRKPIANHTDQAIQRARSRAKAFFKAVAWRRQQETHSHSHKPSHQRARALKAVYAKGERTILVEIPNIPKTDTPAAFRQVKTDRQAKKIKQERQAIKKPRRKPSQGRYKLKPQSNSRGCSEMRD